MFSPRKTPGEYVPLHVLTFKDSKIIAAGEAAAYLWVLLLIELKTLRTDGVITLNQIRRMALGHEIMDYERRLNKLIEVRLIVEMVHPEITETTFTAPSWTRWNLTEDERADVLDMKRENDRERAKQYRARKKMEFQILENELNNDEDKVSKDKRRHVTSRYDESVTNSEVIHKKTVDKCQHGHDDANKCALCRQKVAKF